MSYKKISNKVYLAKEELAEMESDFSAIHQEDSTEIVSQSGTKTSVSPALEKAVEQKIDKIMLIFKEQNNLIEDKNKVIFMLQQRV